jgi:hypothetical protein
LRFVLPASVAPGFAPQISSWVSSGNEQIAMLSESRIAKTQAVEAQPFARVSVTIAWSCSVSSNPP